jgi:biotin operon repressor
MKKQVCKICFKSPLNKDEIGINKKLLGTDIKSFFCLDCLADYLECTEGELLDKIEEFKEEGCTLFK